MSMRLFEHVFDMVDQGAAHIDSKTFVASPPEPVIGERRSYPVEASIVGVSLIIDRGHPDPYDRSLMIVLMRALQDERAVLNRCDRRGREIQVDIEATLAALGDCAPRRLTMRGRPGPAGYRNEVVGEWTGRLPAPPMREYRDLLNAVHAPPIESRRSQDMVDALNYAMTGVATPSAVRETARALRQTMPARENSAAVAAFRGRRADMIVVDDINVDPSAGCVVGDPSSHDWIDTPQQGPTAKKCQRCSRITGQFYSPEDRRRWVDWLVSTIKTCVLLWAQSLDASEMRFSLLELDLDGKPQKYESPSDSRQDRDAPAVTDLDSGVARFAMLELD